MIVQQQAPPPAPPPAAQPAAQKTVAQLARERLDAAERERQVRAEMERLLPTARHDPSAGHAEAAGKMAMQAAAPEAAGMMGAEAAAGPAGLAIAGVLLVKKKIDDEVEGFKQAIGSTAEAMKSLAANDNLGALTHSAEVAGFALGHIPVVGGALEGGLKGLTGGVNLAAGVIDAFVERGKQLASFSPELAAAGVNREVTDLLADIREAQLTGADLARLTEAETSIRNDVREILLPLKQIVTEKLADLLQWLAGALAEARGWGDKAAEIFKSLPGAFALALKGDVDEAKRTIELAMKKGELDARNRERDRVKPEEFLDLQIQLMAAGAFAPLPLRERGEVIDVMRPIIPPGGF